MPAAASTRAVTTLPALERELSEGLLQRWTQLVQADPLASCFQSPGWCVPWYRSYHDEFDPFVVLVMAGAELVGCVPLAVRRATREISFASGTMADYRDIVALPGWRQVVVSELLRVYLEGRFPNPLQIGWIDPASDTPALVAEACRMRRVPFTSWEQPCYRWFPADGENLNKKFSRIRTHLNHFKRLGTVAFDVITNPDEWARFRTAFFQQHTLRQLQADRTVSFDDPRKQRFYDRLFDSAAFQTHVTALRLDGELLSGHVGLVWNDVLMLGAPSISIEHEQRSPALILLSWVMQNASDLGLKGFDLTVGDTEFKRRLGNQCVSVTMLEVYGRRRDFYRRRLRDRAVAVAKRAVAKVAGEDAWKRRVRPWIDAALERGAGGRLAEVLARLRGRRTDNAAVETWEITPGDLPVIEADRGEVIAWQMRENRIEDLLMPSGTAASTERAIRECARSFARRRAAGGVFTTLIAGDQLAAWCFVQPPASPGEPATVHGLHVVEEWRVRGATEALLARVARAAFASGAPSITVSRG
ncbi:MAG TPA: GNAT family N-acetyltransferase [Vicinamibacterales bacterium]|nr:GNAT family N-acetyltransferase [Vicinamibacterales bacterium]